MVYFDLPFLLSIRPTYITYCEGDAWPRTGDRVGIKRHILLSFGRYVLQIVSLDVLMTQYIEINPRTTYIEKLHYEKNVLREDQGHDIYCQMQ